MNKPRLICILIAASIISAAPAERVKTIKEVPELTINTNKSVFLRGETVFFEVMLANTTREVSSSVSIQLFSCSQGVIAQKLLPMIGNVLDGSITIPEINIDEPFFFLYCALKNNKGKVILESAKKVFVTNSISNYIPNAAPQQDTGINLNYLFEGGSFVNNLDNTLFIKAFDKKEQPLEVYGSIQNNKNEILGKFKTGLSGIAQINVIPYPDEELFIAVNSPTSGKPKLYPLPMAAADGLTFHMQFSDDSIRYTAQLISGKNKPLNYTLNVLQNNTPVYSSQLNFDPGKSQVHESILRSVLPDGILVFQLADDANKIYTERKIYNRKTNPSIGSAIIINDTATGKKYEIELPAGFSEKASLVVNLLDSKAEKLAFIKDDYLGNNLNALADGNLINDELVFNNNTIDSRSFKKEDFPDMLSIQGTFYTAEGLLYKNGKVIVIINDPGHKQFLNTVTDQNGRFKIDGLTYSDSATVYFQQANNKKENRQLTLILDKPVEFTDNNNLPAVYNLCSTTSTEIGNKEGANKTNTIENTVKSKLLSPVTVQSKKEIKTPGQVYEDKYVSPQFHFTPAMKVEYDFLTKPAENTDYETVAEFMRGRIPDIMIHVTDEMAVEIVSVSNLLPDGTHAPVQVYINEIEAPAYELYYLYVRDCALIRFYTPMWRPRVDGPSGGTLIIYKKRGDEIQNSVISNLNKLHITGYNYNTLTPSSSKQPHEYQTVFWEPNCQFPANKTINIGSTEGKQSAEIKISGINSDHIPFTFVKRISLK